MLVEAPDAVDRMADGLLERGVGLAARLLEFRLAGLEPVGSEAGAVEPIESATQRGIAFSADFGDERAHTRPQSLVEEGEARGLDRREAGPRGQPAPVDEPERPGAAARLGFPGPELFLRPIG